MAVLSEARTGAFEAQVTMVEPMGWETRVHMQAGDHTLMAQHTGQGLENLKVGAKTSLQLDASELYAFDTAGLTVAFPTRMTAS